ncbi:MAG: glyoxalase [Ruminiclostridium sp.]|nr:glyoxalase [Ruminiclostridium sp.]
MKSVKLVNVCPVLLSEDIVRTVDFYVEKLGFQYAKHYDKIENFAALYRDSIELIIIQSKFGKVESNTKRYGAGYDIYIDTDTVEGVDVVYQEFLSKGVTVLQEPRKTDYGCYEFVIEDIDGRQIGVGLIFSKETFFRESSFIE